MNQQQLTNLINSNELTAKQIAAIVAIVEPQKKQRMIISIDTAQATNDVKAATGAATVNKVNAMRNRSNDKAAREERTYNRINAIAIGNRSERQQATLERLAVKFAA